MSPDVIKTIQEELKKAETMEEKMKTLKGLLGAEFESIVNQKAKQETEKKIQFLKSKGLTSGGIERYLKEADGVDVSRKQISNAMEKLTPEMQDWLARPLSAVYPVIFLDGMRFPVKENGRTVKKCSYHIVGIDTDGQKDLLGIWIADTEGAKFWMRVLNDIRNRGVEDVLIACIDGLKGFPQAIESVFPKTDVQLCINHLTRYATRHVGGEKKGQFYNDLKTIYQAPTEEAAFDALQEVKEEWPQFEPFLRRWEEQWPQLATYFSYSEPVRRLIYTTNHIESLHSQFRRVTNSTHLFTSDEHLRLTLWAAQRDITKKWHTPINHWGEIVAQFAVMYSERLRLY